jgi:hypothetical protein
MPNIPDNVTNAELLAWFEQHGNLWRNTTPPGIIGVSAAQIAAFNAIVAEARKDFDAAQSARLVSKQATVAQHEAFRDMRRSGGDLVNTIKSFIEQSGNTNLWATAGLEPPAPRGETPPPNAPYQLSATLDSEGNLNLKWKATQPQGVTGVVYFIKRALNGSGTYTQLDTVGEKKFTDSTVPVGTSSVAYVIIAKRGSQQSSPSESLTLRFGRAGGGGLTIVGTDRGSLAA